MPYAKKGEAVTCMRGHVVFRMPEDLDWQTPLHKIRIEPRMADFCECGAPYARWSHCVGIEFHFSDGWRDMYAETREKRRVFA
jgi:hypothetical protein